MVTMAPRMLTGEPMRQRGFTYLALLFVVAIMGVILTSTVMVWHTVAQREKEQELLYAGHAIRQAIGFYYEHTPGIAKQYPKTLEDLLQDKRQAGLARYLRKIYIDPITASKNWGVISGPGGTIMGVYSRSVATPVKIANFEQANADMAKKNSYQHWQFIYLPTQSTAVPISLPQPEASTTPGVPTR